MSRFALALAFTLIAVTAFAQVDPRKNPVRVPDQPAAQHGGTFALSQRPAEHVTIGEHAPDFELVNAAGDRVRLRDTRGQWIALFFTDRREELSRISGLATALDSLKVRTLAVCPEKVQSLGAWRDPVQTHMVPLADERGDISALYGLWDAVNSATRQGFFLLDPQGVVRLAILGQKVGAPSLPGLVQSAVEGL